MNLTYEQYIEGNKEQFYKFLDAHMIFQDYEGKESFRWFRDTRFSVGEDADFVFLWDYQNNSKTLGFLKILETPNKRLKLIIRFDRRFYDESKHAWLLFRTALIEAGFMKIDERKSPSYLLERQIKVEALFKKGDTDKEIAARIGVSVSTVKRIKKELGLRKRKP